MKKTTSKDDLASIARLREGDVSAFRDLVEKYKDMSFTLACSILKDENEAEDALQDSFIKLYNSIDKFKENASFSTWLYRIVVNTCFNIAKRKGKVIPSEDLSNEPSIDSSESYTGLDQYLELERKEIIEQTLNTMKTDEALILRLFYLSEMNIKEITEITGYSASKIKVSLHRGRINLHSSLKEALGNEIEFLL